MKAKLIKVEKERQTISKTLVHNVCEFYPGTDVLDFIRRLHDLITDYPEYDTLYLVNDGEYDSYWISLVGYREENDDEYEKRTSRLLEAKQKRLNKEEKQERILMKQLIKKYGKSS